MKPVIKKYCHKCKTTHMGYTENPCAVCGIVHPHTNWRTTTRDKETIYVCGDHYRSTISLAKKMDNLSPQEVMSGVQYGLPEQKIFNQRDANENWSKLHSEGVKELREEL